MERFAKILILSVFSVLLFVQIFTGKLTYGQIKPETLKSALIYQFTQNIAHAPKNKFSEYRVCFLSRDSAIFKEFQKIIKTSVVGNKIKGKPVVLEMTENITNISNIQVLYVDKYYNEYVESIRDMIREKNILMITDQCPYSEFIMLNLLYDPAKKQVFFEYNKTNLLIESLSYNPEILLNGGKEIDIRELYENTKTRLDEAVLELELSRNELSSGKLLIEKQKRDIEVEKATADSLKKITSNLISKIESGEKRYNNLTDSVVKQQKLLNVKLDEIRLKEQTLKKQNIEFRFKEVQIANQTKTLDSLVIETIKQKKVIRKQTYELHSKESQIEKQRQNQYRLIFGALLLLLFVGIFLTAFLVKKRAAVKLEQKVQERTRELQEEIEARIKYQNELVNYQNKLEEIIEERTKEILQINEQLQTANRDQIQANSILNSQKEELEQTLSKLQETQLQLIHAEKMASLGVLTAGVAHEINNPINFINSGLDGLQNVVEQIEIFLERTNTISVGAEGSTAKNEDIAFLIGGLKKMSQNIKTGVTRASEIVKSLRAFSRTENENLTSSDINSILDSALTLLHNDLKNRIEIIKNYKINEYVYCYPGKLNQVFVNIIQNATHAISDKGTIEISTHIITPPNFDKQHGKIVRISIKDTGFGMTNEVRNRVFEPFYTTKATGKGTGLGLSISHGIIEQHLGKIEVKSQLGFGSEFIISFPADLEKKL